MSQERIIYTPKWFWRMARPALRDLGRSVAFGVLLAISFAALFGIPYAIYWATQLTDEPGLGQGSLSAAGLGLLILGVPACVLCWWAALEVADDRHWQQEAPGPTLWDEREARWISSTIAFAKYLESRGQAINVSLVRYDDARAAAHGLIDRLDSRTIQLYLSLISAINAESVSVARDEQQLRQLNGA